MADDMNVPTQLAQSSDIVTRLRIKDGVYTEFWQQKLMDEAADEIGRLRDQLWAARTGKALLQLEEARTEIDQVLAELAKARKEITELRHELVIQAVELLGTVHK